MALDLVPLDGESVMSLLTRYLGVSVAISTAFVLLVLVSLFAFTVFIGELDDIGKGDYTLLKAALFVAASLPTMAYQLFPTVALLGSVVGLGIMANNNELLAMRAAGVSVGQIAIAVMKTGLILVAVNLFLGEAIAPITENYAQNLRAVAMTDKITLKTRSGFWVRDSAQFVHIREMFPDGKLGGVAIYEFDERHRLAAITRAAHAIHIGDAWMLHDVTRTNLGQDAISTERKESMPWGSLLNPQLVSIVSVQPEFLSAWGLYNYLGYLKDNGLSYARYEQALWKKLVAPFSTAVMVFLAIPFVFGSLRSVAIGQRILVSTLVGIGFYVANQLLNYVGLIYDAPVVISVLAPPLAFFGLALVLVRRVL